MAQEVDDVVEEEIQTLGQVAHQAATANPKMAIHFHCNHRWADLTPQMRDAWEFVGQAVAEAIVKADVGENEETAA